MPQGGPRFLGEASPETQNGREQDFCAMERFIALGGLGVFCLMAWLGSTDRRRMNVRLIVSGIVMQVCMAMALLWTRPGAWLFELARVFVSSVVAFSDAGAEFVFGTDFTQHFAFSVLPTIVFVSSLTAVLFHLGVLQAVVRGMARVMVWVMDTSGTESLTAAANVYIGMTEAPLLVRPYILTMTRSELMAMMSAGMATVAGGVMAAYTRMGADAGHLMAASLMSAPAALVIAKMMVPECEESVTKGVVRVEVPRQDANLFDAACRGASDGLKLALNVAAMLIVFIAMIAMINGGLGALSQRLGGWSDPLSLQKILGWIGAPLAWLMGVPWADAPEVGGILGERTVLNEFIAYQHLVDIRGQIAPRSFTIATYALCGFANFGSIGVLIGGLGGLVPERRGEIARLGFRSMVAGTLASFMTAAIAGMLIP